MDLIDLRSIKKEEPVDYFLFSTSASGVCREKSDDIISNNCNSTEIVNVQIKQEPDDEPIEREFDSESGKDDSDFNVKDWFGTSTKSKSKLIPAIRKCDKCYATFKHESNWLKHIVKHKQVYSCAICRKSFFIKRSWEMHKSIHEEKKYKCDICSRMFSQKSHLAEHMQTHFDRKKTFKCKICSVSFYRRSSLNRHMRWWHSGIPRQKYRCPNALCDKIYASITSFKMHACVDGKRPDRLRKINCSECEKSFVAKNEMIRHFKRNHEAERYAATKLTCNRCNKTFLSRSYPTFILHVAQNCRNKVIYHCDHCSKSISSKPKLLEHFACYHNIDDLKKIPCSNCKKMFFNSKELIDHLELKYCKCDHCGQNFKTKPGYDKHKKMSCMPRKTFEKYSQQLSSAQLSDQKSVTFDCHICRFAFINEINLVEHMSIVHTPGTMMKLNQELNLKFHCFECNKSFLNQRSLWQHKSRIHIDKRSFKCNKCNENFVGEKFYRQHLEVYHCAKKMQCTICSKKYWSHNSLRRHHLRSHSGTYECEHCQKKFKTKVALTLHLKNGEHRSMFECEYCFKKYLSKGSYKNHINNHCKRNPSLTKSML